MDTRFMEMYPEHYITIINEIDKYAGAAVYTDQISKRTIYRLKKLLDLKKGEVGAVTVRCLTKRAAHECLHNKKQANILTDEGLYRLHAANVPTMDKTILTNETIKAIHLLTEDESERITVSAWANGCTDTDIAHVLTDMRGGSFESNRSKVRRFKRKLRKNEQLKELLTAYCR